LQPEETELLRLLAAIEGNGRLADQPPLSQTVHWQSPSDIADIYANYPEALDNVAEIISQCGDCLPDGRTLWPDLSVISDQYPVISDQSPDVALVEQATTGLHQIYGQNPAEDVTQRLQTELSAINQQGFAPLFLLVADIVRFARETNVPVSTRGSVANSLVAYCLRITTVDPIEHRLIFERFLNPARRNLPDIDLDFCSHRRDEILNYVRQKYGKDKVALAAMMNTFQPKSAVRETAKAYGLAEAQIKQLSQLIPRRWPRHTPALAEVLAEIQDESLHEVVTVAWELIGRPRNLSVHPGGIVITPGALTDTVPVQWATKGFLTTQFDTNDLEAIGLPKIDLLGIRALTVLADAAELIRQQHDPHFRLEGIDMNDAATADLLANGRTIAVFQCESSGAQRTLRQLQVKNVPDLAIANAFFKPGPAMGGNYDAFIRRYRGEEEPSYLHPALAPILERSQGVLLFQEQVLRVATEIAELSWAQADHLRRGMSKMNQREMKRMQMQFTLGCQRGVHRLRADQAETLWQQVVAFAGYGFNQGHATAYADVSYRSAYLKAHYPAEFLCARLADAGGFHHQAIYIAEAVALGIPVQPPHVNASGRRFTLSYEKGEEGRGKIALFTPHSSLFTPHLWMGLGQVRDLRRDTMAAIVAGRPFTNLRDLLTRVPMQTKEITHLIQCGALDGLGESRAHLLAEVEGVVRAGNALQMSFGFVQEETAVISETLAQRLEWEQHLLGLPVSGHPLQLLPEDETADDVPLRYLPRLRNQPTTIAGCRLPGWTGSDGFFFSDGQQFVIVQMKQKRVATWKPMRLHGIWREDEWGNGRFEVNQINKLRHDA
jgi:DNA-directed DNA polymerase III PolC